MPLREDNRKEAEAGEVDGSKAAGSSVRNLRKFSCTRVVEDNCGLVLRLAGTSSESAALRFRSFRCELMQPSSIPYLTHLEQGL